MAEVRVLPVPGGPCMRDNGSERTRLTAFICEWFRAGRPGTVNFFGGDDLIVGVGTVCPRMV